MKRPPEWVIVDLKRAASRDISNLDSMEFSFEDSLSQLEDKRDKINQLISERKEDIERYKESVIEARNYLLYLNETWGESEQ